MDVELFRRIRNLQMGDFEVLSELARCETNARAAAVLGIDESSVGRALARLEERLGWAVVMDDPSNLLSTAGMEIGKATEALRAFFVPGFDEEHPSYDIDHHEHWRSILVQDLVRFHELVCTKTVSKVKFAVQNKAVVLKSIRKLEKLVGGKIREGKDNVRITLAGAATIGKVDRWLEEVYQIISNSERTMRLVKTSSLAPKLLRQQRLALASLRRSTAVLIGVRAINGSVRAADIVEILEERIEDLQELADLFYELSELTDPAKALEACSMLRRRLPPSSAKHIDMTRFYAERAAELKAGLSNGVVDAESAAYQEGEWGVSRDPEDDGD